MEIVIFKWVALWFAFGVFGSILLFWMYAAVMNFKRVRDIGNLSKTAFALAMPLLIVGYALDIALNIFFYSVVCLHPQAWGTMSSRFKKYNNSNPANWAQRWRKAVAQWAEPLLDPLDPSGNHI